MAIKPTETLLANMSFTPDVPSSALQPNEYNEGKNIETDVRGIKVVNGEQYILSQVPGNIIYITSGFRNNDVFWFICITSQGKFYGVNTAGITDLTPITGTFTGYSSNPIITDCWNGNVLFINDNINPPMYLLPTETKFRMYDNAPDSYVWNYYSTWSNVRAGFVRLYNSPNLGSLLVAGNITANIISTGTTQNYPTTVRWSQNFGLNAGPTTWAPTLTNVANELEVPVRGPVVDGFALNGNFYVCSYWDTVVFSPIAYQSSTAPVFGIKLLNQGRGLLNENCWSLVDNFVFGLDARDIWRFDGGTFTPIGNQRIKNYFYSNLNPTYSYRTFMIHNSSKYQIEIYYPDLTSTGYCNKMISYRYDLDAWQAPRDVSNASSATEGPQISGNTYNDATRKVFYSSFTSNVQVIQKDVGTSFVGNTTIPALFQRNNISFGQPYSAKVQVHRVLPKVTGTGNIDITIGGSDSVQTAPTYKPTETMTIDTDNPWVQIDQNDSRVVTIQVSSNSAVNTWQLTSLTWQITQVEDTR